MYVVVCTYNIQDSVRKHVFSCAEVSIRAFWLLRGGDFRSCKCGLRIRPHIIERL